MTDDEMRQMPIPSLQPDWGILCLWVTGRAMELGRELFQQWGYRRVDELVWVKTSQLGRLIRTGRTGHWLKWVPPPSSLPFPYSFLYPWFQPCPSPCHSFSCPFLSVLSSYSHSSRTPQLGIGTDKQPYMRTPPSSSQNPFHSSSKRPNPMGYTPNTPIT
jgi:hypothetical protein